MDINSLIDSLKRLKVETGSLVCLGCGHEHNCSVHGCAIINEAIRKLEAQEIADNDYKKLIFDGLLTDEKDDPDIVYSTAKIDQRLRQIVGDGVFNPWEVRYG